MYVQNVMHELKSLVLLNTNKLIKLYNYNYAIRWIFVHFVLSLTQKNNLNSAPVRTQAAIPFCMIKLPNVGIFAGRSWVCGCSHLNFDQRTVETKYVSCWIDVVYCRFIFCVFFKVPLGPNNDLMGTGSPFRNSKDAGGWGLQTIWIQCRWLWIIWRSGDRASW